jgi:hypothetical protein
VVNVLPQLHVTLISVYLGWVSIFMVGMPSVLPGARLDARTRKAGGRREPRESAIIREMAVHRKLRCRPRFASATATR